MSQRRSTHYLLRDPGLALPLVALVLNLVFLAWLLVQTHHVQNRVRAVFSTPDSAPAQFHSKGPLLVLGPGEVLKLNGEALGGERDLQYRLSSYHAGGQTLVVRLAAQAEAQWLARVMQACAAAGFTNLVVETPPAKN